MNKRNQYTAEFKFMDVLEILLEEATVNEIASRQGISPVKVSRLKKEFAERASKRWGRLFSHI